MQITGWDDSPAMQSRCENGLRDWNVLSPPGTACPVIETVRDSDYTLLVTEPTPFGLHDLKLAVEVVRELGIPCGVVVNRDGIGDDGADRFCDRMDLPILMRIPHDEAIARDYSRGETLVHHVPEWKREFGDLWESIRGNI